MPSLFVALPALFLLLTPLVRLSLLLSALLILALPFCLTLIFRLPALLVLSLTVIVPPLLFALATLLRLVVPATFVLRVLLVVLFLFFPAFAAVPFAAVVLGKSHRRRSHPEQDS